MARNYLEDINERIDNLGSELKKLPKDSWLYNLVREGYVSLLLERGELTIGQEKELVEVK